MAKNARSDFCSDCKRNPNIIRCTTFNGGQFHHSYNGKPSIKYKVGTRKWFHHGLLHRLDGPAIHYAEGIKEYFIKGNKFTEQEWKKRISVKKDTDSGSLLMLVLIPVVILGFLLR